MKPQLSEAQLLTLISDGDQEAFAVIYTKYLNNIYRYIVSICYTKETNVEIVQNLFVKVWGNRAQLNHIVYFMVYPYKYSICTAILFMHL